MAKRNFLIALLISFLSYGANAQQGLPFANEVMLFERQDSISFPRPGGALFIGSSSIRRWADLEQRFPDVHIIKRGVGGSELWQWVSYYTPYLITPYKAAKVFIYAGENDLAGGKSARYVTEQFIQLWQMIREKNPDAEIFFLAVKQSPSRAKYYNEVLSANKMIKAFIDTKTKTQYVDVATPILKAGTAMPDSALFGPDMLHLNSKGYDKWQSALQSYLK